MRSSSGRACKKAETIFFVHIYKENKSFLTTSLSHVMSDLVTIPLIVKLTKSETGLGRWWCSRRTLGSPGPMNTTR